MSLSMMMLVCFSVFVREKTCLMVIYSLLLIFLCKVRYLAQLLTVFVCKLLMLSYFIFFFKQNTAYDLRIRDWSSDVCSSDLCFSWRSATAAASTCSRRRFPSTRLRCANTSAATARSTDRNDGAAIPSALRLARGRRRRRQDHGAARAARRAAGRGRRSRQYPRAGRHAAGGDDPRPAARSCARTAGCRDRAAADVRRARPARARNDPASA